MEQIEDTIIYQLLIDLNIPCKEPPYTHLQNNNHSVTDNKTFFIKTNTEPKGLQIELETLPHLTYAPKPLHLNLLKIHNHYILITEHIQSKPIQLQQLTENNIAIIIHQLKQINSMPQNVYSDPRTLEGTLNLINSRMSNPSLTKTQRKQLDKLIQKFITPYIIKYENTQTLAHTDMHLKNILYTTNNQILIIDYEGIKPSPPEADLASLYQSLQQNNQQTIYSKFEKEFIKQYPNFNQEALHDSVLFKNTLTTTACIKLAPHMLDERIEKLTQSSQTNKLPEQLPQLISA